jgi:hypothetical protein
MNVRSRGVRSSPPGYAASAEANGCMKRAVVGRRRASQWCRNAVAHRDIIPPETIERLSDLYVSSSSTSGR